MTGFGGSSYGAGPYGSSPDVTITGVPATLNSNAWAAGIDNGFPILNISGTGHTSTEGDANVHLGILGGAIQDFFYVGGLSASPTVDPLETVVLSKSFPTESNSAWVRASISALSPKGFWTSPGTEDSYNLGSSTQVWPRTARGIVGVYFDSTANNEQHYVDDVQFEKGSTATSYDNPRDTKIAIIPDRINALPKQQFTSGTTSPITAVNASLSITSGGLSITWTGSPAYITYPVTIPTDLNRGWVTISVYCYNPPVGLEIKPVNTAIPFTQGFSTDESLTTRIWTSYPIDATGVANFILQPTYGGFAGQALFPDTTLYPDEDVYPLGGSYVGTTVLINQFMAEASANIGDYFDSTYQYTNDIVVGASGAVSLFDNKKVKNYRLTQILNQTLPIGATFTLSYKSY